jgi:hypothetical protein
MPQFPRAESAIATLAQSIISGLQSNPGVYPAPPVVYPALQNQLLAFGTAQQEAIAAQAAARQAIDSKEVALIELTEAMKSVLRYAEITVDHDDARLQLLGWNGRATRRTLDAPGQCRTLEAPRQGEGWLLLDWKEPLEGGKPAAYKIQRRARSTGEWQDVATAIVSELTLVDQPRGVEQEYRVVAINRAGEGEASNAVMVVL